MQPSARCSNHWCVYIDQCGTVCSEFIGQGKAVDTGDPILPLQMPRGYGGTIVLWKCGIDHLIATLPDGGNRIQCAEIKGHEPVPLVLAYMHCNGMQGCFNEFEDTLDQLSKITAKYSSHQIIIGGDVNEDIIEPNKNSKRLQLLQNFLLENKLS